MKQTILVFSVLIFLFAAVSNAFADCPAGNLSVWFPDGSSTTVPSTTACCYKFPSCEPCSGHDYDAYVAEHFEPQCGPGNSKRCVWRSTCSGI